MLVEAGIREARSIVVAVSRDDAAVPITLTAREMNPDATIVAAVRGEENVHLLHRSGATSVITTAGAAGRLLGHAIDDPRVTELLEDLLSVGEGLDIAQRPVAEGEVGPLTALLSCTSNDPARTPGWGYRMDRYECSVRSGGERPRARVASPSPTTFAASPPRRP